MPSNSIIELRHELHRYPEVSGCEKHTAARIIQFFEPLKPDQVIDQMGGNGLAVVFGNGEPTLLLRCELDALPIAETIPEKHCSTVEGVSHKCGHDGHMAILCSVGHWLSSNRPGRGRVVLLFQPAEETGTGAQAVLQDQRFASIRPDFAFAVHNLPGFPFGHIVLRNGLFCCASSGMIVKLIGRTAHAAQPETGASPASAMCEVIQYLEQIDRELVGIDDQVLATVVGADLGEKSFGIAPGTATVMATLRCERNETMQRISDAAEQTIVQIASKFQLECDITYADEFHSTWNCDEAMDIVRASARDKPSVELQRPFRWSEDFGRFSAISKCALVGIGAGEQCQDLHDQGYDFPDQLIDVGAELFKRITQTCLDHS